MEGIETVDVSWLHHSQKGKPDVAQLLPYLLWCTSPNAIARPSVAL